MARPLVGPVTERVYASLPELYRDADAAQVGPDYPLLRYLSLLLDQLTPVDELRERFSYEGSPAPLASFDGTYGDGTYGAGVYGGILTEAVVTDVATADLVDPARADGRWLPWLAQLLGIGISNLTVAEARAALATPETSWDHGTPSAIAEAAATKLTGTKAVEVTPHYGGDPFTIGIGTLTAETSEADTFGELKAIAPRWADLKALGSFANAKAPAPILGAQPERPAGYRLAHHYTG